MAVGLILAYVSLSEPTGDPEDASGIIAEAMAEDRGKLKMAAYIGLVGAFMLLWFVGYLTGYLRRAERDGGWLTTVAYGGGLATTVLLLVSISFTLAESVSSSYGADTQVAETYLIYHWDFAPVLALPLGALVAASTVVGFRFSMLPSWLNWVGVLTAGLILGLAPIAPGLGAGVAQSWLVPTAMVLFLQGGTDDVVATT
jgi:hypothetical protein